MAGLTFVVTGVLETIEREAAGSLIEQCGGRVTSNVSRKTSYIVVGDEAGPKKVQKVSYMYGNIILIK